MKTTQKTFRIGTLAQTLLRYGIQAEPSAIRFWEKEFSIQPKRSKKGHRFYTQDDINRFIKIHDLLYKKKFTIAGAKQIICSEQQDTTRIKIPLRSETSLENTTSTSLTDILTDIKKQLLQIRKLV